MNPSTTQKWQVSLPVSFCLKLAALTFLALALLGGCAKSPQSYQRMSGEEQLNFLRAQARQAMLVLATNDVPNLHNVIEENADTFGGSVDEWRGWVRLDFVAPSGALQQTNIPMTFAATDEGHLFGFVPVNSGSRLTDLQ